MGVMRVRRAFAVGAGAIWIASGIAYVTLEAIAAAGYVGGYSYAQNYISDLGVTTPSVFEGRTIDSPRALVMNIGFYLQGALFLTGAALAVRAFPGLRGRLFVGCAATHAVGLLVVGTIHGGGAEAASGGIEWHMFGAGLAIVGGNAALLAGAALARKVGTPSWYWGISATLGVLGLLSVGMLLVDRASTAVNLLPEGTWERGSVYTVTVWEIATGVCLLALARRAK
jgi:hypothetical membrane protein